MHWWLWLRDTSPSSNWLLLLIINNKHILISNNFFLLFHTSLKKTRRQSLQFTTRNTTKCEKFIEKLFPHKSCASAVDGLRCREKLSLCMISGEKRKLKGLSKFFQSYAKLSWYRYTSTLTRIVATRKYLVLSPRPSKSCKSECFSRQIRALTTLLKLNGLLGSGAWWRDWRGKARVAQLEWTWAGNLVLYSFLTVEDDDDRWFICICCLFLRFLFFD